MTASLVDKTVRHETFGKGTIIEEEVREGGRETLIKVRFQDDDREYRLFYKRDLKSKEKTIFLES